MIDFDEGPADFFVVTSFEVEEAEEAEEDSSPDSEDDSDSGGGFGVFVLRMIMASGSTVIMSPGLSLTLELRS